MKDAEENVCNWMLPADSGEDCCPSCRLNEVIPDLSVEPNRTLWAKLEAAKRRMTFSLMRLGLPLANKQDDPQRGLAYRFLAPTEPLAAGASGTTVAWCSRTEQAMLDSNSSHAILEELRRNGRF